MTGPTLRRIRPDDHARVGELLVTAYDAVGRFDDAYRGFLADPDRWVPGSSEVWVAVDPDDRPVGCIAFVLPGDDEFEGMTPAPGDAGFRFLAVAPEAQGTGVGGALVDAVVERARVLGCRRIAIHTMAFMTAAHGLYASRGFEHRRDLDVVFPGGLGHGMTLDLTDDAAAHFPPPGPVPDEAPWFEDAWRFHGSEDAPIC
jgi:GNAT superfamily N-acetyltransferase